MLSELRIKDFAIIDALSVTFGPGLNVLTGETGAGKSIIVDAFGLTLGERAQTDMIKTGKDETVVEALFDLIDLTLNPLLERLGLRPEEGLILRRIVSAQGKNRAYINDSMVNAQSLAELGHSLVDIHSQHEHQSLISTENQRTLLDAYGKLLSDRAVLEEKFREVQDIRNEITVIKETLREKGQRTDLLKFQINEIDSASLKPGEKEALIEERAILTNSARLNELTDTTYSNLYGIDGSAYEKLSAAVSALREVAIIDHTVEELLALLEEAKPLIEDAASSLRSYRDKYDIDPNRLDMVEERIESIKKLERKYGESITDMLKYRDSSANELQGLVLSDEKLKELEKIFLSEEAILHDMAGKLTGKRKAVAVKIEEAVQGSLKELAMEKAAFRVEIKPAPISSTGMDQIEFLFSANIGEPPKPLGRVASGGELSRIMLALKETLAEVDNIPVLIFDEVDAGIGGRTAESVGASLKKLSKKHQVLCITHLPQIASRADNHIMIEKIQKKDGVHVRLKKLSANEREEEIARMLSGKVTDISLSHARELLERSV